MILDVSDEFSDAPRQAQQISGQWVDLPDDVLDTICLLLAPNDKASLALATHVFLPCLFRGCLGLVGGGESARRTALRMLDVATKLLNRKAVTGLEVRFSCDTHRLLAPCCCPAAPVLTCTRQHRQACCACLAAAVGGWPCRSWQQQQSKPPFACLLHLCTLAHGSTSVRPTAYAVCQIGRVLLLPEEPCMPSPLL